MTNTRRINTSANPFAFVDMVGELLGSDKWGSDLNGGRWHHPYNVIQVDQNTVAIEIALAGFKQEEITVSTKQKGVLEISGRRTTSEQQSAVKYTHRGISVRDFTYKINMHRYNVDGATYQDGILTLTFVLPAEAQPTVIPINGTSTTSKQLLSE